MRKDATIEIKGVQKVSGETDTIEVFTKGSFYKKNNCYYITYDETGEMGAEGVKTTLKVDENKITMLRSAPYKSQLIIEKGNRHLCSYSTGFGDVLIGVSGNRISYDLTDSGGRIQFAYTLDVDTALASENEVHIIVKECITNV